MIRLAPRGYLHWSLINLKSKQTRTLLVGLLAASLIIVGAFMIRSVRAYLPFPQAGSHPGTLDFYAEQAQAQGLSQYTFPAGIIEYSVSPSWDDAVSRFSFVLAEPIEVRSYPRGEGVGGYCCIQSWYRFRVLETLSSKPTPFPINGFPTDMAPPQSDQLLIWKSGGRLTRNGVQLFAEEPAFPEYTFGQRYLLILFIDLNTRGGDVSMGSYGVYSVNASGVLTSIDPGGGIFDADLASRYGNSINSLRAALNGSPIPTPTPTPTPPTCNATSAVISRCTRLGGIWNGEDCTCDYSGRY
jgi:hypothetical protein